MFAKLKCATLCPLIIEKITNLLRVKSVTTGTTRTRGLLNRLTPQNSDRIIAKIVAEDEGDLATLVLEAAITQPGFLDVYLRLFAMLEEQRRQDGVRALVTRFRAAITKASELTVGIDDYDLFCATVKRKGELVSTVRVLTRLGAFSQAEADMLVGAVKDCDTLDVVLDCVREMPQGGRLDCLAAIVLPADMPFKAKFKLERARVA